MKAIGMKLEKMLPGYSGAVEDARGWSGVRVTLPDKQPVIGSHHALPGLYLIGAMGSKGLWLARYLADLLMRHILIGVEIPEEVSIRRYLLKGIGRSGTLFLFSSTPFAGFSACGG